MTKTLLLLAFTSCLFSCQQENTVAQPGQPVPHYTFSNILNSDEKEISISSLKGKPVILEFWATWCGPCIPAMKKLERLQKQFQDEIEIIAVSTESQERLGKFIDRSGTSLKLVSDTAHVQIFKYQVIPHAILIDKNGIIKAITSPQHINENLISDLISGKEITLPFKDDFLVDTTSKTTTIKYVANKEYSIELRAFEPQKSGILLLKDIDGESNGAKMWTRTLDVLYKTLFDIPSFNRVVYLDSLRSEDFPFQENHRYSLLIETSEKYRGDWKQLGIDLLSEHFDINAKMGIDTLDCYVLKNTGKPLEESTSSQATFQFSGSVLKAKKISMSKLTEYLEKFSDLAVLDQTNLSGLYDISLEWFEEDPKTLHAALKRYGLQLERSEKKLPVKVMKIYRKQ